MTTPEVIGQLPLHRSVFDLPEGSARIVYQDREMLAQAFRTHTGVEVLRLTNPRGHVDVLPFLGQIIWDVVFDGIRMTMDNQFTQPRPASAIQDTYGCFAFHSGLLAAGVPGEGDDHLLHGEFACADISIASIVVRADGIGVRGAYEYVRGFEYHYSATPSVILARDRPQLRIGMEVYNLSSHLTMPLQYMCHINSAYVPGAEFIDPTPQVSQGWQLRQSVPGHVHPTQQWLEYTEELTRSGSSIQVLTDPQMYDPEIVFLLDDLPRFGERLEFALRRPDGVEFHTSFDTAQFPVATRWILHNPDQQVAAYVLPGTSRPEGRRAAQEAGTLIQLPPGQGRHFEVTTGLRSAAEVATKQAGPERN